MRDIRYSLRSLGRTPGFAAAAVMTLALGIGATTAICSVVYGVLLRPLPFPGPERLVVLQPRTAGVDTDTVSPASFLNWQARVRSFERITAFAGRPLTLTGIGDPGLVTAAAVTIQFFDVLRVQPALGRTFLAQDGELLAALGVFGALATRWHEGRVRSACASRSAPRQVRSRAG